MTKTIELSKVRQGERFTLDGVEFVKLDENHMGAFIVAADAMPDNCQFESDDAEREDHNNFSGSHIAKVMERWLRDQHKRNAYGRQLGSFHVQESFKGLGEIPMTFIRAPYIESVSGDAEVLAVVNGNIVAARQGKQLVTAFHPELTEDLSVHRFFLDMLL